MKPFIKTEREESWKQKGIRKIPAVFIIISNYVRPDWVAVQFGHKKLEHGF